MDLIRSQYLLGVIDKVGGNVPISAINSDCFGGGPFCAKLAGARLLFEEEYVGCDRGALSAENLFGKSPSRDQFSVLSKVFAGYTRDFVHRSGGGDERDKPTWFGFANGFCDHVIVEQKPIAAELRIKDRHIFKWDVSDHEIVVVVRQLLLLQSAQLDRCIGIQERSYRGGDRLLFDCRKLA